MINVGPQIPKSCQSFSYCSLNVRSSASSFKMISSRSDGGCCRHWVSCQTCSWTYCCVCGWPLSRIHPQLWWSLPFKLGQAVSLLSIHAPRFWCAPTKNQCFHWNSLTDANLGTLCTSDHLGKLGLMPPDDQRSTSYLSWSPGDAWQLSWASLNAQLMAWSFHDLRGRPLRGDPNAKCPLNGRQLWRIDYSWCLRTLSPSICLVFDSNQFLAQRPWRDSGSPKGWFSLLESDYYYWAETKELKHGLLRY